jgi:SAM-dependent methyltransferase
MTLSSNDRTRIVSYFQNCLNQHGYASAKSLDWVDRLSQQRRFQIFEKIEDLNGKKILDFGSGLGDFYGFLKKKNYELDFVGVDIVPEFVDFAQNFYPAARFVPGELEGIKEKFDFVFASGSLSFNMKDHKNYLINQIKKMLEVAERGVGFNLLDNRYFTADEECVSYNPEEIFQAVRSLAAKSALIQGYLPQDFTIFSYK